MIRRKTSSASAGGGSPGSKSLHLSPLSNNSERHPRKSQTLFTFPDPGTLSAGSGLSLAFINTKIYLSFQGATAVLQSLFEFY